MAGPWVKIEKLKPVNLVEIMSEEIARDFQAKEDKKFASLSTAVKKDKEICQKAPNAISCDDTCSSDELIARMLQMQFDNVYDENLRRTEEKYNGFEDLTSGLEGEKIVDIHDLCDWECFDTLQRQFESISPCGYKTKNGSTVTKHDVMMRVPKNVFKRLSLPTGNGGSFDLKISNQVFNSLKLHSKHEEARHQKVRDKKEERATQEFGLDEYTRLISYKIIQQEILDNVNGVISIGKEAVILHADVNLGYTGHGLLKEYAIKVFKTMLSKFKQRDEYIKDSHVFKGRLGNQAARKTVHLWAAKEMHNLNTLRRAGIPCPEVVILRKHILKILNFKVYFF